MIIVYNAQGLAAGASLDQNYWGGWIERLVIFMQTFRYLYKRVNSTEDRKTDIFQTPNEMG